MPNATMTRRAPRQKQITQIVKRLGLAASRKNIIEAAQRAGMTEGHVANLLTKLQRQGVIVHAGEPRSYLYGVVEGNGKKAREAAIQKLEAMLKTPAAPVTTTQPEKVNGKKRGTQELSVGSLEEVVKVLLDKTEALMAENATLKSQRESRRAAPAPKAVEPKMIPPSLGSKTLERLNKVGVRVMPEKVGA